MSTKIYSTITSKITFIIIISVVVATTMIGSVFYYKGRSMFIDNASLSIKNRLKESAIVFENYYENLKGDLKFLAYINENTNSKIEDVYHNLHKFYYDKFYIAEIDETITDSIFLKNNPILKEGILNFKKNAIDNFSITDIHRLKSDFGYQWAIYRSKDYYYMIKVNFISLLTSEMSRTINNNDYVIVLNDKGNYLYSPYSSKNFSFEENIDSTFFRDFDGTKKYFDKKKSFSTKANIYNEDYLFIFSYFKMKYLKQDLYMGIGFNIEKYLYSYNLIRTKTFVYTLLLLLATVVLGSFFSKYITRGLKSITKAAQDYTAGKSDIHLGHLKGRDEIGILAITLQGMMHQLNERNRLQNKQEKELRMARDEAEKALKEKSYLLENLNKQKSELENLTKEKDDLMAIVSHDLKNPLSVIDASMNLIKEDFDSSLSEMSLDLISRSKNSAKISLRLITDLLDLARYEGGIKLEYSKFNLLEMVSGSLEVFNFQLKDKNINLKIEIPKVFFLQADFSRFAQVVINIVGNAIKFTPQNGEVIVKAFQKKAQLLLSIKDNGAGIPEDKLELIFDKFSQARDSDRAIGTGLGLAICQKICELHKGEVFVNSALGKGTEFVVQIPGISQEEVNYSSGGLINDESKVEARKVNTILLVEDDDDIRMMISEVLEEFDFKIIKARTFKEAEYLLSKNKIDFLITDFRLADLDGLELIKAIRKTDAIPSVIISGNVSTIPLEVMQENQIIDFLIKPFKLNVLADILLKYFDLSYQVLTKKNILNILFVDDSDDIRNLIKILLKKSDNISLDFASDGSEAFQMLKDNIYDFIFMDDQMPLMSGVETMVKIKAELNLVNSYFVSMSANNNEVDQKRYFAAGFNACLGKPISKQNIMNVIENKSEDQNIN